MDSIKANEGPVGRYGFHYGDYVRRLKNGALSPWLKIVRARKLTCYDDSGQPVGVAWFLKCREKETPFTNHEQPGLRRWRLREYSFGANQVVRHSYQRGRAWMDANNGIEDANNKQAGAAI